MAEPLTLTLAQLRPLLQVESCAECAAGLIEHLEGSGPSACVELADVYDADPAGVSAIVAHRWPEVWRTYAAEIADAAVADARRALPHIEVNPRYQAEAQSVSLIGEPRPRDAVDLAAALARHVGSGDQAAAEQLVAAMADKWDGGIEHRIGEVWGGVGHAYLHHVLLAIKHAVIAAEQAVRMIRTPWTAPLAMEAAADAAHNTEAARAKSGIGDQGHATRARGMRLGWCRWLFIAYLGGRPLPATYQPAPEPDPKKKPASKKSAKR